MKNNLIDYSENDVDTLNPDDQDRHIARHYKNKRNSDVVNVPRGFRRDFFSPKNNEEILDAPITVFRIMFKVFNDASFDQFQPERQPMQLKLFEKELMNERNTYVRFTFKVTDIDKNRDYNSIRNGLEFLENSNRGWHKTKNSKGKPVQSFGGVIVSSSISRGKVSFLMSTYWVERILKIPFYNDALLEIPWKINKTRQILFYLWLLELKKEGTKINFNNFQKTYRYNYKEPKGLVDGFFRPLKKLLDRCANVSFNYSLNGNLIHIKSYPTKDVDLNLSESTISKLKITQKLHYWKLRHELEKEQVDTMRSVINIDSTSFRILLKSYDRFISRCRDDKAKATEYKGEKFMVRFQSEIIEAYKESVWGEVSPEAYPRIN